MGASRIRPTAFKLLVGLVSVVMLVGFVPVLHLVVIDWLPDDALLAVREGPPEVPVHRLHSTALSVLVWSMIIGIGVQLHRPRRKVAAMLMALAVPPAIALGEVLTTGTYVAMGTAPFFAVLLLIAVLHPAARQLVRIRRMDPIMSGLTAVAAVPCITFAVGQRELGRLHGGVVDHWTFVAALSILVVFWGLIGASDRPGWKLPAWAAALTVVIVGLKSLLFPEMLSRAPLPWAVAALIWAGCYLIAGRLRERGQRSTQR